MNSKNQKIQAEYYTKTSQSYDKSHLSNIKNEHDFALSFLSSCIEFYNTQSVLDVGAGTGRALLYLKKKFPNLKIFGIEPVENLREEAYSKGLAREVLIEGYGEKLSFEDESFDLVCEFGILHHVPHANIIISEMLRVSRIGIFISDSNNFGQGNRLSRFIKQGINAFHLWKAYNYIRTKGKVYQISEGDGLFYSYSVFNDLKQIKNSCPTIHIVNTQQSGINPYRSAPHVALIALKKK